MERKFSAGGDNLGILASLICALHCAILPIFFTSLPILGVNIIHYFPLEIAMIVLTCAIGIYAIYGSYKKHHRKILPIIIFSVGMFTIISKEFFEHGTIWFYMLLSIGVLFIICAHLLNYKYCKQAKNC
jgi:cadmium resistance protein CadD (predicted permease)